MKPTLPIGTRLLCDYGSAPEKFVVMSVTDGRHAMHGEEIPSLYLIEDMAGLVKRNYVVLPPREENSSKGFFARLFD